MTPDYLEFSKRFLVAVDTLSLKLCWGVEAPFEIADVPISPTEATHLGLFPGGPGEVLVDPWPFGPREISGSIEGVALAAQSTSLNGRPIERIRIVLRPT